MQEEQYEKCQNCNKQLPISKIATHFGYCRRNIKKCQDCGEMYDINLIEQHQEQFHAKSTCDFCHQQIPKKDSGQHAGTCSKKPLYCQYCQLNIPLNQFQTHILQCASRTQICEKCGKSIVNKFYFGHITTCQGEIFQELVPPKYQAHRMKQRIDKIPLSRKQQFETGHYPHLAKTKEIKKQNHKESEKKRRIIHSRNQKIRRSERGKTGIEVYTKNVRHQPQRKAKPVTFIDLQAEDNMQEPSQASISKPHSFNLGENLMHRQHINQYGMMDQDELFQQAIMASLQMAGKQKTKQDSMHLLSKEHINKDTSQLQKSNKN